jgi:hypothetical protein
VPSQEDAHARPPEGISLPSGGTCAVAFPGIKPAKDRDGLDLWSGLMVKSL